MNQDSNGVPMQRISHLEGRVAGVEGTMSDHSGRLDKVEQQLVDVRLGMERLHGDLRLNNQATDQIQRSVSKIEADTSEMIALYRATPRMREGARWWVWAGGVAWAVVMVGATIVAALR